MSQIHIYTLANPITKKICYVGSTKNLRKRMDAHMHDALSGRKTDNCKWIRALLKRGITPVIETIDIVPEEERYYWEGYWIAQLKAWDFKLYNMILAGQLGAGPVRPSWNAGTVGVMKANITSIQSGQHLSTSTEIKKGQRLSPKTEFKKGDLPPNAKQVLQFDKDGKYIATFDSCGRAGKQLNINGSNIQYAARNGTPSRGYYWKYAND